MIRIVCFDLGGVLVRICPTWDEALEASGIEPREPKGEYGRLESFEPLVQFQSGKIQIVEYLGALADWLGGMEPADALAVHNAILLDQYPGMNDLLDILEERGLRSGCLSNTNDPHWQAMATGRLPAFDRLDVKIGSQIVGASKPDPAIYDAFELAAGCAPEEVVYFEDTPLYVDVAAKRGWSAHLINSMGNPVEQVLAALD